MKFECSQQLEQQLRDEIRQLKQENAHLVRGAQTGVNREAHGHYGYQHGGEDIDLIVATLRSENSHLLEQNRQQKKYFEVYACVWGGGGGGSLDRPVNSRTLKTSLIRHHIGFLVAFLSSATIQQFP